MKALTHTHSWNDFNSSITSFLSEIYDLFSKAFPLNIYAIDGNIVRLERHYMFVYMFKHIHAVTYKAE